MLREIARACEDASWDDDIRVVVVTGEGRAFCVGADLRSWEDDARRQPQEYWKWFGAFKDMHDRLRELGKPTIARINGIAVGGGNELQMACDLAVMVDDAFIRHVGLEHGSVPAGGATQWLQLMVGDRRAREIVFLCEEIPAPQAAEWGSSTGPCPRTSSTRSSTGGSRASRASCRRRRATRSSSSTSGATSPGTRRRPRARLAAALDARRRGQARSGVPGVAGD
jgi:enoyl-CoA hydratase/carnithine racemase